LWWTWYFDPEAPSIFDDVTGVISIAVIFLRVAVLGDAPARIILG
jgi:hypothetical protein